MSDLFRDFLVWLMGFTGCSVLVFAAACFARKQFKIRQRHVAEKQPAEANSTSPAVESSLSPKLKWLVFALAPVLYFLLLGPALSELIAHFQKMQRGRAALSQTADIPQTLKPIPDSIGSRGLSPIGDPRISTRTLHRTGPCSCDKKNQTEAFTQSTRPDESEWEVSPGWQLSTGDMNDVSGGGIAEVDPDAQID